MRDPKWDELLRPILDSEEIIKLKQTIKDKRKRAVVIPGPQDTFEVFNFVEYDKLKIVIVGREPYASDVTGHGLAFSTKNCNITEELRIIFKTVHSDIYSEYLYSDLFKTGNLYSWAAQGILLLNPIMTVEENRPSSHKDIGWEYFTTELLKKLNDYDNNLAFIFMGKRAAEYKHLITRGHSDFGKIKNNEIDQYRHLVIETPYPMDKFYNELVELKPFYKAFDFLALRRKESQFGIQLINEEIFSIMWENIKMQYRQNNYPLVQGAFGQKINIFDKQDMRKWLKYYFAHYGFINLTSK